MIAILGYPLFRMKWALAIAILLPLGLQAQPCSIEGRVNNLLSGGPVRKAKVVLGPAGNPKYQAITDSEGHFSIAGVAAGRYVLSVQRTGFLPTYYGAHGPNRPGKSIILVPGESRKNVNFFVEPPGVITGHIYDQDGETLSATVQLFREVWRDGIRRIENASGANANDEGEYRLFGLPAGNYIVATAQTPVRPASPVPTREVYPPTFYPGTDDASSAAVLRVAPGGEARGIDIRVRKTVSVSVSGNILTTSPDPGMRISLARRDGVSGQRIPVMFPQPGEFAARNLTSGSYVLSARSQTEYASQNVDVGSVDVTGVQLQFQPQIELTGVLKIDGQAPAISITLNSNLPDNWHPVARPDAKGALSWKGLTPGKWTVDFAPKLPGVYLKSAAEIEVRPQGNAPVEIVVSSRGASIEGKAGVEAATVLLITDGLKNIRVIKHGVTDGDGRFSLNSIPPGKYRLLAIEDIENDSWENPAFTETVGGKGIAIEVHESEKINQDLTVSQS